MSLKPFVKGTDMVHGHSFHHGKIIITAPPSSHEKKKKKSIVILEYESNRSELRAEKQNSDFLA